MATKKTTAKKAASRKTTKGNPAPKKDEKESDTDSSKDLLDQVESELSSMFSRPAYNGHYPGCPASTSTSLCSCNAAQGQALLETVRAR